MLYPKDRELRVEKTGEALVIEWNWNRKQGIGWLIGLLVILSCLWFAAHQPNKKTGGLPSLEGIVLLGSLYTLPMLTFGLSGLLNRTRIVASKVSISMKESPIPFRKSVTLSSDGVQQFFTKPGSKKFPGGYLYVIDSEGYCSTLAQSMPSDFATNQICHELQDFYGLEDLPVYGQTSLPHQPGPRSKPTN